tara:strand:- start:622 stop:1104 length:483 start_codon:yes stop_codon:yes gene_type:complete
MTWRETLEGLKEELAEARTRRKARVAEEEAELAQEREDLTNMVANLGVNELLADINSTLLDGKGEIETIIGWESAPEDNDGEDSVIGMNGGGPDIEEEPEAADVITTILSWEEGGELEIAVDVGLSDDGIYLQINEIEIRAEREALEQGLIEAFRDELDL